MEICHHKNFSKSQQNKPHFLIFYSNFLLKVFKIFKILLWQAHRTPEPVSVAYKVNISRNLILFLSPSTVHRLILADYQIIACYGSFSEVSLGTGDKVSLISAVPLAGLLS